MRRNGDKRRGRAVTLVFAALLLVFLGRMFYIQAVQSREAKQTAVSSVTVPVEAMRGEIRDRNGELLVANKQVRTVIIDFQRFPSGKQPQERSAILLSLIRLFRAHNEAWKDNLPIRVTQNGTLRFISGKDNEVSYLKSKAFLHLNPYATVDNCFQALSDRYELADYSVSDARDIASVYYSMHKDGFNAATSYTFADDVSEELVASLKERSDQYPGVDVRIEAQRDYIDGTIAPLFWFAIGGVPLAVLYRAANTMDSMLGYKNERYLYFGRPAARLDDVLNYIPARITGLLFVMSAFLLGYDGHNALRVMRRDAAKHPSPNGGYAEAAMAGALQIRLGGENSYFGQKTFRAYMGDVLTAIVPQHILAANRMMYTAVMLFLTLAFLLFQWCGFSSFSLDWLFV